MKKIENKNLRLSFYFNLSLTFLLSVLMFATATDLIMEGDVQFQFITMLIMFDLIGLLYMLRLRKKPEYDTKKVNIILLSSIGVAICLACLLFLQFVVSISITVFILNISLATLLSIATVLYIYKLSKVTDKIEK